MDYATEIYRWIFTCLLGTWTGHVLANRLVPCHQNPCQNGGSCMKTSDTVVNTYCPNGFTAYQKSCYNFVQRPAPWFAARRHCKSMQSTLVSVDSQREREFLKAFLEQHSNGQDPQSFRQFNIWAGGRAIGERGNVTWMWMGKGEHAYVKSRFWETNEPNQAIYFGDACIAITATSSYLNWAAENCDHKRNFYICEQPELYPTGHYIPPFSVFSDQNFQANAISEENGHYFYQCRCKRGFSGINCEIPPEANQAVRPSQQMICENEPFEFACPRKGDEANLTISVDYAVYGRPTNTQPPTCISPPGEIECVAENSLLLLIQRCQGLPKCSLPALNQVFNVNPCIPGTINYLEYRFRCEHAQRRCPENSVHFKKTGKCYLVVYKHSRAARKSWEDARSACASLGGDLVGPIDSDLHNFLVSELKRVTDVDRDKKVKYFWIGLKSSGAYAGGGVWNNGETLNFQPSSSKLNRNGHCVAYYLQPGRGGRPSKVVWLGKSCNLFFSWICEFSTFSLSQRPKLFDPMWNLTSIEPVNQILSTSTSTGTKSTSHPPGLFSSYNGSTVGITISYVDGQSSHPDSMGSLSTRLPPIEPERPKFCKARESRGLFWHDALAGSMVTQPCPAGTTGDAHWYCRKIGDKVDFHPPTPDLSKCKHAWVGELEKEVSAGQHALKVGEDLKVQLQKSHKLYGGDISGSLDIIRQLVPLQKDQLLISTRQLTQKRRAEEATNFTRTIGATSDLLLREESLDSWKDFPPSQRHQEVSVLMKNLEFGADMLTHFLGRKNKRSFKYDNIAMKVEVHKSEQTAGARSGFHRRGARFTEVGPPDWETTEFIPGLELSGLPEIELPAVSSLRSAVQESLSDSTGAGTRGPGGSPKISHSSDEVAVRLGYFLFTNLAEILKPIEPAPSSTSDSEEGKTVIVNSYVIGASVNNPGASLKLPKGENVTLKMWHLKSDGVENPRCVFWDAKLNRWDPDGCHIANTSAKFTFCTCNHLTSFAVLMDFKGTVTAQRIPDMHQKVLKYLTMVGCALSALCLTLCIIVFTFFPSLWGDRNTIHRNLCICLLIGELLFLFGIDKTGDVLDLNVPPWCTSVAVLLHYFFLTAFFWMLMEGYQLYLMLIKVFEPEKSHVVWYYIVSYGVPAIIVGVSVGIRSEDYGTKNYCWIDVKTPAIYAFIGPISMVILANIVFLVVALKVVFSLKGWLKGSTMLLCLLGITWIFGYFFVIAPAALYFAYVFTVFNCLQGVFIFVFHVVLNEKVRSVLVRCMRRTCNCCFPDKYDSTPFNSSSATGSSAAVRTQKRSCEHSGRSSSTFSTMVATNRLIMPNTRGELKEDNDVPSPTEEPGRPGSGSGLRLRSAISSIVPAKLRKNNGANKENILDVSNCFEDRLYTSKGSFKSNWILAAPGSDRVWVWKSSDDG